MPPTTLFGLGYGTGPAGYGYPPGARRPSISYPDSPFTWYDHVEITASLPTNGGGPITNYSVLSGSLPTGVSLNATTGELTGTPTTQQSAASVVIRARGPGGVSDTTISVEVLAMPLSLGTSLAAWYKADAGCYTDAACLFASASSQYLSKTSPTFAPTTKMTIAFDYKPTTLPAFAGLCGRRDGADNQWFVAVDSSGNLYIYVCANATDAATYCIALGAITSGANNRVVIVYDGTLANSDRVAMYVNSAAQTVTPSGTTPTSLRSSACTLTIGQDGGGNYANGALARLGFSSLALSGAALTAAHTSTFWADMTAARQADWFSFYNLCEASSTRVDSTGLNNLTPTNGPTVAAGPGEGAAVTNSPWMRLNDQSGNGKHLTQTTIAKELLYVTGAQNGLPGLRADGTDDSAINAALSVAQPFAVFIVAKNTVANGGSSYLFDDDEGTTRVAIAGFSLSKVGLYCDSGPIEAAHTYGAAHVYEGYGNGASSEVFVDGVSAATGDAGTAGLGGIRIAARFNEAGFLAGDIYEILIVSNPTVGQRASARAYLRARWGI